MLAYRNAAAIETPAFNWGDGATTPGTGNVELAKGRIDGQIEGLKLTLNADAVLVALSVPDQECFRRDVLPSYKSNRRDKVRPSALRALKDHLLEQHAAVVRPGLEADDIMGIKATDPNRNFEPVIVTIDKDLRQIPGIYYNPFPHKKERVEEIISPADAGEWWMYQTLIGDECDGYKGCPGIGPKKAALILNGCTGNRIQDFWPAVVFEFKRKGLTEADALVQARVSRILRHGEWSPKTGVRLWSPQSKS